MIIEDRDTFFLSGLGVWEKIGELNKETINKKVAVAYIGSDVKLEWYRGDELLIALTEDNVRAGIVDPNYIENLINDGVQVYKEAKLHAKIYLFEKAVVVGSMNSTGASQTKWLEAAICCTNEDVINSVKAFFDKMAIPRDIVTLEELQWYKGVFNKKEDNVIVTKDRKLWVINSIDKEFPEAIKKRAEENRIQLSNTIGPLYNITRLHYSIPSYWTNIQPGDYVIRFYKNKDTDEPFLFPPCECIRNEQELLYLKEQKYMQSIPWSSIRQFFTSEELSEMSKEVSFNKELILNKVWNLYR